MVWVLTSAILRRKTLKVFVITRANQMNYRKTITRVFFFVGKKEL